MSLWHLKKNIMHLKGIQVLRPVLNVLPLIIMTNLESICFQRAHVFAYCLETEII